VKEDSGTFLSTLATVLGCILGAVIALTILEVCNGF
jgi:hypothetical protein